MNGQPVPDGMTTDTADGKPAKRVTLSKSQQFDNFLFNFTPSFMIFLASGWTLLLWFKAWQRWTKKHPREWFRPQLPKMITVTTIDHQHITIKRILSKDYHINYLFLNYQWKIVQNTICLQGQYLVAKNMFDKVDSVLFNAGNQYGLWFMENQPGTLRHVRFTPHAPVDQAQRQTSQRPAQPVKAKLGKIYEGKK
jgi:hypothetical protein